MKRYEPQDIEPKWQSVWEETRLFAAPESPKNKKYIIPMFPYPSGDGLHVGHPRPYTAADITAHYHRYRGEDVLHATGWDAFGLPAENAAIKKHVHPAENTATNIANFRRQLKRLGFSYDWNREVDTSSPEYYRWTQWIFLQLHKAGLAYRAGGWQWWCPSDKTVLANEQVIDGACERCGTTVTKKELTQWYFKVTQYADELLNNLEELDWPESIKALQRNWIGRSVGTDLSFNSPAGEIVVYSTRPDTLFGASYLVLAPEHSLVEKLTTPEQLDAVKKYVADTKTQSEIERTALDREKSGVFTGSYAENPANGERLPIWIADYVLASYGTGAIMAVPAHDDRDMQFAKKFDLPIKQVIMPETGAPIEGEEQRQSIVAIVEDRQGNVLSLRWKDGQHLFVGGGRDDGEDPVDAARREVAEETGYTDLEYLTSGGVAKNHYRTIAHNKARVTEAVFVHFKLRSSEQVAVELEDHEKGMFTHQWLSPGEAKEKVDDPMHSLAFAWLIEGVAYTGEGVLINSGDYDGLASSVARDQITADLGLLDRAKPTKRFKLRDWLISRQRYWGAPIPIVHCDDCGEVPVPEKDLPVTLPSLDDYLPTGDGRSPLAKVSDWVSVECPSCGKPAQRETDTMDTFADSSWYFLRYPSPHVSQHAWDAASLQKWAPVDVYVGGADHAVLHLIYARFWTMALSDLGHLSFREPFLSLRHHGMIQAADGQKMSKSKGNVVNPDEIVEAYGADTLRVYEMFIGPYDQAANWSTQGIEGVYRFLKRVWVLGQELSQSIGDEPLSSSNNTPVGVQATSLARATQKAIRDVTRSIEQFRFNTAVSALMEALNELYQLKGSDAALPAAEWRAAFETYLILLSPLAPHIAEELWSSLGNESSIFGSQWPEFTASLLADETVKIVVQVNGKVRATVEMPSGEQGKESVTAAALADPNVQSHLAGSEPSSTIYVPGKLINFVLK